MRVLHCVVAALTASSLALVAGAQQAPRDSTAPAGSGGANNPELIGEVSDAPPPKLPDGTPDFRVTNEDKNIQVLKYRLCAMCG